MNEIKTSKIIGKKIRNYRINEVNESQELFAQRIHCAQTTLSKYENQGITNIDDIEKIESLLGINLIDDSKENIIMKSVLDKIYSYYIHNQNKKLGEIFLTKNYLKTYLLYGYDTETLENILLVLRSKDFISIIKNDKESDDTEFILMKSKGILILDNDSIFPSKLSGDNISTETLMNEFIKYDNSMYIGNQNDPNHEKFTEILQENISKKQLSMNTLCNNTKKYKKKYMDLKNKNNNTILSKSMAIGLNNKSFINHNVLILDNHNQKDILEKNIMQSNSSYIIFDTNEQLLNNTGIQLEREGYTIKVLNLADPDHSFSYNPIAHLRSYSDTVGLVDVLFESTSEQELYIGQNNVEKILLTALILYLQENMSIANEEKNFTNIVKLLQAAEINENDYCTMSVLDKLFAKMESKNTNSQAVRQYKIFKLSSSAVQKESIVNCMNRLSIFTFPSLEALTSFDNLELSKISDEKTALFIISPSSHCFYNFLISILYTQLIRELSFHAEFECSYEYYIKNKQDILVVVPPHVKGSQYTERDAKRLLESLKRANVRRTKNNRYLLKARNFEKAFDSEDEAKSFILSLENSIIEKGTGQLPNNICLIINDLIDKNLFPDIESHLMNMHKIGLNYMISIADINSLKTNFNKAYDKIIDNCSILIASARDFDTFSYIEQKFDISYDFFDYDPNKCLLIIKGLDPMVDDIYISNASRPDAYDYKYKISNENITKNRCLFNDTKLGIDVYSKNVKQLEQHFKDNGIKSVQNAMDRIILTKDNGVVKNIEGNE